ncbi:MAG: hypothetical protein HY040_15895 [Planctomycetes bacterium]|nr:hypothetical protein [Planctomycetota bacterium]
MDFVGTIWSGKHVIARGVPVRIEDVEATPGGIKERIGVLVLPAGTHLPNGDYVLERDDGQRGSIVVEHDYYDHFNDSEVSFMGPDQFHP